MESKITTNAFGQPDIKDTTFMTPPREAVKNYLADFSRKGGTPPSLPLAQNHFAKKPLTKSRLSFSEKKNYLEGLRMMF